MNRRHFLRPQRLRQLAAQALGLPELLDDSVPPPETALLRFSRRAMATMFEVVVPFGTPRAQDYADAALDEIDSLEEQLTVYRPESEVSRLNEQAANGPVVVEERLFALFSLAARINRETEGAFDISVGALIKAWGFYRRQGRVPSPSELEEVRQRIGMEHVCLAPEASTLSFRRRGLEINFGSIGKGYALDRVLERLVQDLRIRSGLFHGGHSSVLALGVQPGCPRGWPVGITHPGATCSPRRLGIVHLRNRALATSAATFQHLVYNGRRLGHILDPRTCWPAKGIAMATVTAPTAAEADALATAFFILGVEKTRGYCERHPGIGAVMLPAGQHRPVVLGYAREEFTT